MKNAIEIENKWIDIPTPSEDYPYDGQGVWVTDNYENAYAAVWRKTRSYDAPNSKWVVDAYWARHNAGGQRLEITPVAFKDMED
jgi:hypothetical protein